VTVIGERYKLGKWITPPLKYAKWDWGRTHPGMLFDRKNDPLEVNNLIHESSHKHIRQDLARFLTQWQARTPEDGKRDSIKSFTKI
jgi:hypothetical protein